MAARTTKTSQINIMKYKSQLISGACIVALAFCAPRSAPAAGKNSPSPAPEVSASPTASETASPTAKALRYHGMIASVDQTAKTFTITGKETSRVFKVTDRTKIMKDGNPATMSDLAEKEEARGQYRKNADGSLEAKTVKLGAKAEKKKESKKSFASPSPSATP
jgi:hypothetical protein